MGRQPATGVNCGMSKSLFLGLIWFAVLSLTCARFHKHSLLRNDDEQENESKHTYYVLVKQEGPSSAELSAEFSKRLGQDNKVRILPASKVIPCRWDSLFSLLIPSLFQDKIVVEIDGDSDFADKIVDAVKSFPESSWVEKKPVFRTRNRVGRAPEAMM